MKVNNEFVNLPSSLGHQVSIAQVGFAVVLQTDFGLRVQYDAVYHAEVQVPSTYQSIICGLCGNYNGNPSDDLLLPDGTQSSSVDAFGLAWALPPAGDECVGGGFLQQCNEAEAERYRREEACGLMGAGTGPFSPCHGFVDPQPHVKNCVFDMCILEGDRAMLCQSLQAYATAVCPENSHYAQCSNNCAHTCASLSGSIYSCPKVCVEGCECDEGFFSDGDKCVSEKDCGCVHNGKYLKVGEVSVSDSCELKCVCHGADLLECVNQTCARGDVCDVQNGQRECYPVHSHCSYDIWGHLLTFDGGKGSTVQPGAFQMAFLCDEKSPDWFRVVLDVHPCTRNGPENVIMVHIFFQDLVITVNHKQHSWVNGRNVSYPMTTKEGVSISSKNNTVIVEKMFTLRLTFSITEGVVLSISGELRGKVCGACGNFNGDIGDDVISFSAVTSWKAEDFFTCDL
ncbi:hypothetical protein DNTS_015611 [Danionella cerebrum]|uniref:VWFD domain-containing protein n=1 Tax=Danionella cerebrum TaxID=2873325 RepID=A0A553QSB2_9TELE|nr:hypothetical protein DNTS_015611 [Danionella translucida]